MANPTLSLLQQQVHRLRRAAENPAQLEAELPDVLQNLQTTLQTLSQESPAAPNGQSEARQKYEFIVNTSQEFMTLINRDYIYKAVNDSYCTAHNKPRQEIVGKSVAEVWGQARFESHIKPHLDECFNGRQTRYRCWFEFARLGRRYFDVAYYPYFDDTQTVTDAVVISRDMTDYKLMEEALRKAHDELEHRVEKRTAELEQANKQLRQEIKERKQVEQMLRESEAKFRTLAETTAAGIFIYQGSKNSYVNPATEALTGYSQQELLAMNFWDVIHPDFRERIKQQGFARQQGQAVPPRHEIKLLAKDGTERWIDVTLGTIEFNGEPAVLGTAFDITGRKQAEQERERLLVAEREQRIRAETLKEETNELNRKLLSLQYIGATIAASLDLQYVLETVTREMTNLLNAQGCTLCEWDAPTDTLGVMARYGLSHQFKDASCIDLHKLVERPLTRRVLTERRARQISLSQSNQNQAEIEHMRARNIKTLLMLPMEFQDRPVGLIEIVDSKDERTYNPKEVAVAQMLANQAAGAIENARLYNQARQEIEERIRAEKELRRMGEINQAILNAIPDTIIYFDHQGRPITYKSGDRESFSGQTLNDALAHNTGSMLNLPPDLLPLAQHYINQTLDDEAVQSFEYELDSPQGKLVFECRLVASGSNQVLAIVRNITKRKQAEIALAQERNLLRTLIDNLPDYIVVKDKQRKFIISNPAHAQLLGAPGPEQVVGKTSHDFFPPDEADRYTAEDRMIFETGQPIINKERAFLDQQGNQRWRLTTKVPLRESNGEITGLISIGRDITKRKQAEAALQESEANLRAIFDNSQQAFLLINRDKEIQAFNRTARAGIKMIAGQNVQKGASLGDYIPQAELEEFNANFETALNGGSVQVEKRVKLRNREEWFEIHFNPVFAENGQIIGVCFSTVNIDERKRAADALAASEARLWAEMRSMLAVSRALVTEIKINSLLEFIMEQAKNLMEADETAVLLLSDDGQHLETANPTESALGLRKGSQLPVQGSLAGVALTSRQVQISSGLPEHHLIEPLSDFLQPAQAHSILCAPLIFQRKSLGVLLAWNTRPKEFTASDSLLMEVFADQAALALYNAELHAQNRRLAVEQERHRLARDLHDSVTQSLYSMGLAAQASLRLLDKDAKSKVREPIEHIHSLSQTALAEMREHLYHLHPTGLDKENLIEVLSHHCDTLGKHYSLNIEFAANLETSLSVRQRDTLYYITREALWNVVKHANASRVDINLHKKESGKSQEQIVLTIKDDGAGFDPAEVSGAETMGLRNIQERVKLLGGDFELQTQPGQGTELVARLPLRPT